MELKVIQYDGAIVPFDIKKMINSLVVLGYPDILVSKSIAKEIAEEARNRATIRYGENPIYVKLLIDIVEEILIAHDYHEIAKVYRNQPTTFVDIDRDYGGLAIMDGIDFHISELNFYACNLFNFKNGVLGTEFWCSVENRPMDLTSYVDSIIGLFNDHKVNDRCKVKCIPGIDHLLMPSTRYTFLEEYRRILLDNFPNYSITINEVLKTLHKYELPYTSILTDEGIDYLVDQTILQLGELEVSRIHKWIHQAKTRTKEIAHTAMFKLLFCLYSLINKDTIVEFIPSINLGTCMSGEGRIIMIALLTVWRDLIEIDKYDYHPTLILKLKKGINRIGDYNHDIVIRLYEFSIDKPYIRYLNLDTVYNLPYYRYMTPYSEISAMSCFNGDTTLHMLIGDQVYPTIPAMDLLPIVSNLVREEHTCHLSNSKVYELLEYDIYIHDTISNKYVKCLYFIINADNDNWYKLSISFTSRVGVKFIHNFYLTAEHVLPTLDNNFLEVKDITIGELLLPTEDYNRYKAEVVDVVYMGHMGELGYDLETTSNTFDLGYLCSHNCRTRIIEKVIAKDQDYISNKGDLINAYLNLPRIAIKSNYRIDKFFTNLDITLSILVLKLLQRIDRTMCLSAPFSYTTFNASEIEKSIQFVAENIRHREVNISVGSTVSISFVGLAECVYALTGKVHGTFSKSSTLGIDIAKYLYDTLHRYTEVLDINIKLSGKYHETLSGRFVTIDRRYFGYIDGVTDRDRYQDSFHIPDKCRDSLAHQIDKEVPYHRLCKGDSCSKFILTKNDTNTVSSIDRDIELICESDIGQFSLRTNVI